MVTLFAWGAPGPMELIIILAILLILFGNRLPSVMKGMGQGITEFKKGIREGETEAKSDAAVTEEDH